MAVPTNLAEDYARLIMLTYAQHQRGEHALGQLADIRGRLSPSTTDFSYQDVRAHATIIRMASIVESFTSISLANRLEAFVPLPRPAFVEDLYYREENAALGGWEQMKSRYKKWVGGLDISSCQGYSTVMSLVEARNAVAHGLGTLTRRQQRGANLGSLIAGLRAIGMNVDAQNRVTIPPSALRKAAGDCRSFIVSLDVELQQIPLPVI